MTNLLVPINTVGDDVGITDLNGRMTAAEASLANKADRLLSNLTDDATAVANIGAALDYQTRAEAIAATVPPPIVRIRVLHDGVSCEYVEDAFGAALTTNGGTRKWKAAGKPYIEHYGGGRSQTGLVNVAAATVALNWDAGSNLANRRNRAMHMMEGIYNFDGTVYIDAVNEPSSFRFGVIIQGAGRGDTLIEQQNLAANTFHFEHTALTTNTLFASQTFNAANGNLVAGQTVFNIPAGFVTVGVYKNGTLLTNPAGYTAATPNVTLAAGVLGTDEIVIHTTRLATTAAGAVVKFQPCIRDFTISYNTADAVNDSKGFVLHSVGHGDITNVEVIGSRWGFYGSSIQVLEFNRCIFNTSQRNAVYHATNPGVTAKAGWCFTGHPLAADRQSNSCTLLDCIVQNVKDRFVEHAIVVTSMEYLSVLGGYYNSVKEGFLSLDADYPDVGTNWVTSSGVVDIHVSQVYLDHNQTLTDGWRTPKQYIIDFGSARTQVAPKAPARFKRIQFTNCYIRGTENTIQSAIALSLSSTAWDTLDHIQRLRFTDCVFQGFGTMDRACIQMFMASNYDEKAKIRGVTISGCQFIDTAVNNEYHNAAHPFFALSDPPRTFVANRSAIHIGGTDIVITGNTFHGHWLDTEAPVIQLVADTDMAVVSNNVFFTPDYNGKRVQVALGATNYRVYGNTDSDSLAGDIRGPLEVVEEGSSTVGGLTSRWYIHNNKSARVEMSLTLTGVPVNTASGSIFKSAIQSFGTMPVDFTPSAPRNTGLQISGHGGKALWVGGVAAPGSTAGPTFQIFSSVSEATVDAVVQTVAFGKVA